MPGPLHGVNVIEMAGIGPAPFCGMMLADPGASVVRIDRKAASGATAAFLDTGKADVASRGRRILALDLKNPAAIQALLRMLEGAEILLEGFRPGVMERLGLGPDVCLARNPRLVYGRVTGWGQDGPLARAAGHDINYIALTGALETIGTRDQPLPPLNLLGDFGGGAMLLAFGVACALAEARTSGKGQVVDAAMTDGVSLLMAMMYGFNHSGRWNARGENWPDGTCAPFYTTYRCADGKWISVGALEPQFYALLIQLAGATEENLAEQWTTSDWPARRERLAAIFASHDRDHWCSVLEGTDACFAPVLDMNEAPLHPHNVARGTFVTVDGVVEPGPAPRFSRTPAELVSAPAIPDVRQMLADFGVSEAEHAALVASGACAAS
jgi:alpha-methylacyl-CoA racemase